MQFGVHKLKKVFQRQQNAICSLWKIYKCLFKPNNTRIVLLFVSNSHEKRIARALFVIGTRVAWKMNSFSAIQTRVIFHVYY